MAYLQLHCQPSETNAIDAREMQACIWPPLHYTATAASTPALLPPTNANAALDNEIRLLACPGGWGSRQRCRAAACTSSLALQPVQVAAWALDLQAAGSAAVGMAAAGWAAWAAKGLAAAGARAGMGWVAAGATAGMGWVVAGARAATGLVVAGARAGTGWVAAGARAGTGLAAAGAMVGRGLAAAGATGEAGQLVQGGAGARAVQAEGTRARAAGNRS